MRLDIFPRFLSGSGSAPTVEDLLVSKVFADALDILRAPQTWRHDTAESINNLFGAPPMQYRLAMSAVTRFCAIAEELHKRKVMDRPYWVQPDTSEVTVSISLARPLPLYQFATHIGNLRSLQCELICLPCAVVHVWFAEGSSPLASDHHHSGYHSSPSPNQHQHQHHPLSYGWRLGFWFIIPVRRLFLPGLLHGGVQGSNGGYSLALPWPCHDLGRGPLPYGMVSLQPIAGIQGS